MNEETIFAEACDIPPGPQRKAFLKQACAGDSDKFSRIAALLAEHDQPDSFLEGQAHPTLDSTLDTNNQTGSEPGQIGPYKLLHLLGEGGMGAVWLAQQQHPVKRKVAVKLIKQGLNSQQFTARFEAERQALAMMDHPNIAKVLDAGCADDGRNYFVMEYVKGIPITQFCDENRLDTEQRLNLFIHVCKAVQHAHQKGVIHRDLKPSNVMVAMFDDRPVPKVIDFGVAKAIHQPLTEHTLCTIPGQIVGTWEYMSPEQAILNQLDVDTRTDIYSLGVILYELMTGQTPLDLKSLKPEMLEERLRRIREQEPARPSNRVSSLGEAATATAAYRDTEAGTLSKKLRGDLDAIVMRALEKDRSNRYETANGFAAEIQRYLNDEPLSFRPPSAWQQVNRLYRRKKATFVVGALVIGILAIGFITTSVLLKRQLDLNEKLSMEQAKNKELLNEYEPLILDSIVDDVCSGDKASAEDAIQKATNLGVSKVRLELLQAIQRTFSGDQESHEIGIEYFKSQLEQNENAQVACAALLWAHSTGNEDLDFFWELIKQKESSPPPEELERVIWAAGTSVESVYRGVEGDGEPLIEAAEILSEIVKEKPNWAMPRVLLLRVQSEIAVDRGDFQKVAHAIDTHEPSLGKNKDQPYFLAQRLHAYHVAMKLSSADQRKLYREEAQELAVKLLNYKDYRIGRLERALFLTSVAELTPTPDFTSAIKEWEQFDQLSKNDVYGSLLGGLLMRHGVLTGDFSKATEFYKETPLPFVPHFKGNRGELIKHFKRLKDDETLLGRFWAHASLYTCGGAEREQAIQYFQKIDHEDVPPWIRFPLDLFLGNKQPSFDLLTESHYQQAWASLLMAFYLQNNGDDEGALKFVEKAIEADSFLIDVHQWAHAVKLRIKNDPDWHAGLNYSNDKLNEGKGNE